MGLRNHRGDGRKQVAGHDISCPYRRRKAARTRREMRIVMFLRRISQVEAHYPGALRDAGTDVESLNF
jgi:hypothetical protein